MIDKFSFRIYKNRGICSLELVGSIDTDGEAKNVIIVKIEAKIYALVADF